ncbi:prepilin-type N-terminal cleavage/methylation domain-containing protein [Candidatus Kaiserbacteria bacterium]|nr:prepilin-type N-terminal cleavage/methylation domain-containing protein [Candidatus Kaiserbacteria bacterium]
MKKKTSSQSGFTLIETLVAISILLIALTAPLTIASRGLSSAYFARDQITAFYLAQDAVEYVRNTRDQNVLTGSSWLSGFPDTAGTLFTVDTTDGDMALCPVLGCDPILYNQSTNFYGYNDPGALESRFTRSVSIETLGADEAVITVTVNWSTGVLNRSFSVKENILNWVLTTTPPPPPPTSLSLQLSVSSSVGGPSGDGDARLEVVVNGGALYTVDKAVDPQIDSITANKEFDISSIPNTMSVHYTATVINDDHQITYFGINVLETVLGTDYATEYSCAGMSYQADSRRRTLAGSEPALGANYNRGWAFGGFTVDESYECTRNP